MKAQLAYEYRRVLTMRVLTVLIIAGITASLVGATAMAAVVASLGKDLGADESEVLAFILGRGSAMPAIAGLTSATLIGSEFRYHTVELTLCLSRSRKAVALAYVVSQASIAVVLGIVGGVIAVIATSIAGGAIVSPSLIVLALLVHVFTCATWSFCAVSFVLFFRSRAMSILVLSGWAVLIEPAVGGVGALVGGFPATLSHVLPFTLLGSLTNAIAGQGAKLVATADGPPPLLAVVLLVAMLIVVTGGAFVRFVLARRV